jgi:excinuclease ABC subunit C
MDIVDRFPENIADDDADPAEKFTELLALAPTRPGVYLMKDAEGTVIYVGKAANLKKRLASYFNRLSHADIKTRVLVRKIEVIEFILTSTENEALILESNLIKKHRPRYNIILKDDKRYPSLRLDIHSAYPHLTVVRKIARDGAMYFGPFTSPTAVYQTLKVINKTFLLRKCRDRAFSNRSRPCLNHQIGVCLAPCCLPVDPEEYRAMVREVVLFLKGRAPELIRQTEKQMLAAARDRNFELAAVLRDKMFALQKTVEQQVVVTTDFMDRDGIGMVEAEGRRMLTVISVRCGHLVATRHYPVGETVAGDSELVGSFLIQYYETVHEVPEEILTPVLPEELRGIRERLREIRGGRVVIRRPRKGVLTQLLELARRNAESELQTLLNSRAHEERLLLRLQKRLGLERLPRRIECFDNSHFQGDSPVSSLVVFMDGRPSSSQYRRFSLRHFDGADDYAFMSEALKRRYGKGEKSHPMPDLLLVDGGKGQLNIAAQVLRELGLNQEIDLAALAKKDEKRGEFEDRVFRPGRSNPVNLDQDREVLFLLMRIRDEAHRTAVLFHRGKKRVSSLRSVLDGVPGIGARRKKALLTYFDSIRSIRSATLEEIANIPGMNRKAAQAVQEALP